MRPRDCRYASLRQRTNRTDFASILNQQSPIGVRSELTPCVGFHQAPATIALGVTAAPITSDRKIAVVSGGLEAVKV